ncbi:MAG: hypothetical protein ACRC37_04235, partial [Lentisphaeria bacterium]
MKYLEVKKGICLTFGSGADVKFIRDEIEITELFIDLDSDYYWSLKISEGDLVKAGEELAIARGFEFFKVVAIQSGLVSEIVR